MRERTCDTREQCQRVVRGGESDRTLWSEGDVTIVSP